MLGLCNVGAMEGEEVPRRRRQMSAEQWRGREVPCEILMCVLVSDYHKR